LINTLSVLVATFIVPGLDYSDDIPGLLVATLLLGILNTFLRPLLLLLSLPLVFITLGLFTLVINAFLLYLVGWLVGPFDVDGFWAAFFGALIISVMTIILNSLTGTGSARVEVRKGRRKSGGGDSKGGGSGPVIDV
jgi:putative membrane protein